MMTPIIAPTMTSTKKQISKTSKRETNQRNQQETGRSIKLTKDRQTSKTNKKQTNQ